MENKSEQIISLTSSNALRLLLKQLTNFSKGTLSTNFSSLSHNGYINTFQGTTRATLKTILQPTDSSFLICNVDFINSKGCIKFMALVCTFYIALRLKTLNLIVCDVELISLSNVKGILPVSVLATEG